MGIRFTHQAPTGCGLRPACLTNRTFSPRSKSLVASRVEQHARGKPAQLAAASSEDTEFICVSTTHPAYHLLWSGESNGYPSLLIHDCLFCICPPQNVTAKAASAAGSDQVQSPRYITATAATTQPTKKPVRRRSAPVSLLVPPSISGWFDVESIRASTAFVKLPVMTA